MTARRNKPQFEEPNGKIRLRPAARQALGLLRDDDAKALDRVGDALATGRAVLFVGSGPSAPLYGDWPDLVAYLTARADVPSDGTFFSRLDKCREKLGDVEVARLLIQRFSGHRSNYEEIHAHLVNSGFDLYVTTNYDCCLERADKSARSTFDSQSIHCYPDPLFALNVSGRSLFHLHGRILGTEDPEYLEVVLSDSDYRTAYQGREDVSDFLRDLLVCGRTVVFCGFGFGDHDLFFRCLQEGRAKLQGVREQREKAHLGNSMTISHYAFLGVKAMLERDQLKFDWKAADKRLDEFSARLPDLRPEVEIVPVLYGDPYPDDSKRSHAYLTKIFAYLADNYPCQYGTPVASQHIGRTTYPWPN